MDEVSNRRLTSMALDVARGLSYLAELKYVHRDVACRNCLVNSSRCVKLADFGMTRPMYENDYYRFSRKGKFFFIFHYSLILIFCSNDFQDK
jgi:serine/threonine protein kinase